MKAVLSALERLGVAFEPKGELAGAGAKD